ncbi:MAG: hypothetical protein WBX18_03530, partial [Terracidiphilus sp.]
AEPLASALVGVSIAADKVAAVALARKLLRSILCPFGRFLLKPASAIRATFKRWLLRLSL